MCRPLRATGHGNRNVPATFLLQRLSRSPALRALRCERDQTCHKLYPFGQQQNLSWPVT